MSGKVGKGLQLPGFFVVIEGLLAVLPEEQALIYLRWLPKI